MRRVPITEWPAELPHGNDNPYSPWDDIDPLYDESIDPYGGIDAATEEQLLRVPTPDWGSLSPRSNRQDPDALIYYHTLHDLLDNHSSGSGLLKTVHNSLVRDSRAEMRRPVMVIGDNPYPSASEAQLLTERFANPAEFIKQMNDYAFNLFSAHGTDFRRDPQYATFQQQLETITTAMYGDRYRRLKQLNELDDYAPQPEPPAPEPSTQELPQPEPPIERQEILDPTEVAVDKEILQHSPGFRTRLRKLAAAAEKGVSLLAASLRTSAGIPRSAQYAFKERLADKQFDTYRTKSHVIEDETDEQYDSLINQQKLQSLHQLEQQRLAAHDARASHKEARRNRKERAAEAKSQRTEAGDHTVAANAAAAAARKNLRHILKDEGIYKRSERERILGAIPEEVQLDFGRHAILTAAAEKTKNSSKQLLDTAQERQRGTRDTIKAQSAEIKTTQETIVACQDELETIEDVSLPGIREHIEATYAKRDDLRATNPHDVAGYERYQQTIFALQEREIALTKRVAKLHKEIGKQKTRLSELTTASAAALRRFKDHSRHVYRQREQYKTAAANATERQLSKEASLHTIFNPASVDTDQTGDPHAAA